MSENIKLEITDRVARIEFSRPPLNMFDLAMLRQFHSAAETLHDQRNLCAVVLQAAAGSRAFSAGIEFNEYQGVMAWQAVRTFYETLRVLDDFCKPIIVAVDGPALSGGFELTLLGDIVIASERALFALPDIRAGLFPILASVHLPQAIGKRRAAELIFTGAQINAQTAAAWGLINHVVTAENVQPKIEEVLTTLRAMSASSLELSRRALRLGAREFRESLDNAERLFLEQLIVTEDALEGIAAALQKRPPKWQHK